MTAPSVLVGISDSHDASACLVVDGRLVAAVAEERFQRIKGMAGFPANAIQACLDIGGLEPGDVEHVVFGHTDVSPFNMHNAYASISIEDHLKIEDEYWYPVIYEDAQPRLAALFPDFRSKGTVGYDLSGIPFAQNRELEPDHKAHARRVRVQKAMDVFGLPETAVTMMDHHTGHAYWAYYANPQRRERDAWTVVTADAGGDGLYESISVVENGVFRTVHRGQGNILATLYSYATLILGMRPNEHEYKLMGLAPYASDYQKAKPRAVFADAISVDGLQIRRAQHVRDLFHHFKTRLRASRFDGIAGGMQDVLEDVLVQWFANIVKETGVGAICYAGGLALNVKANKLLSERPEIDILHTPPAAGDESLSIGACLAFLDRTDAGRAMLENFDLEHYAYLGTAATNGDREAFENHPAVRGRYARAQRGGPDAVAEVIATGDICAVFQGRMEFGPRALGHRSIIADPSRAGSVEKINNAIKMRDFWMPFAPAVLDERFDDYLVNAKDLPNHYMTLCLDSTEAGRRDIPAGLHPHDHTARPQRVTRGGSPLFHEILSAFERRTGIGGVLNTSLNIHGKPIVEKPVDIAEEIISNPSVDLPHVYIDGVLYSRS